MEAKKTYIDKYLKDIRTFRNNIIFYLVIFIILSIVSYCNLSKIYRIISKPLLNKIEMPLIYTSITEPFLSNINISILFGLLTSMPFLFFQLYIFISKGLKKKEKIYLTLISISPVLFYLGIIIMYKMILPGTIDFFISCQNKIGPNTQIYPKINDYIRFVVKMGIGFGVSFELPIFIIILTKSNIVNLSALENNRRIVLVLILIFAAIVTPPDILSQIILGSIMFIIYEMTILTIKLLMKNEKL